MSSIALGERGLDAFEQDRVLKRLLDHVDGAGLDRLDGRRHVGMGREQDHGQEDPLGAHLAQEIEAAGPLSSLGEAQIQKDAADVLFLVALEELVAGGEGQIGDVLRAEQELEGVAMGLVVVDDADSGFGAHGVGSSPGMVNRKTHPVRKFVSHPQSAAVRLDEAPRDGQTEPHSVGLRRNQRAEEAIDHGHGKSGTMVDHRHAA